MKLPLLSMLLPLALALAPTTQAASCNLCLYGPDNMAFDGGGNLYLVDTDHKTRSRILKLSPQGRRLAEWHVFGVEAGRDNGPDGIALDRAGNVFVVDRGSDRILKLSPRRQGGGQVRRLPFPCIRRRRPRGDRQPRQYLRRLGRIEPHPGIFAARETHRDLAARAGRGSRPVELAGIDLGR